LNSKSAGKRDVSSFFAFATAVLNEGSHSIIAIGEDFIIAADGRFPCKAKHRKPPHPLSIYIHTLPRLRLPLD
jgi:hypothetical protein